MLVCIFSKEEKKCISTGPKFGIFYEFKNMD